MSKKLIYEELEFRIKELGNECDKLKQEAEEQKERKKQYQDLYDNAPDMFASVDAKTATIINCNMTVADKLGYTKEEIIGRPIFDLYTEDSAEIAKKNVFPAFVKTGKIEGVELQLQRKDGSPIDVLLNVSALYDEKGDVVYSRSVWRDITERKQSLERTEQLNRLNEDLLVSAGLDEKLKLITDTVVKIFKADFARIWIIKPGDLCDSGCWHAKVTEEPHVCCCRERCLHLLASSGRYTHLDGGHRRVPLACYKIGLIASGEDPKFLTNDVTNDPNIHDHEWAKKIGLVSFAGYRLFEAGGGAIGVLALFSKQVISSGEDAQLKRLEGIIAQVIQISIVDEALKESKESYRFLTENIADIVWVVDRDFTTNYVSPSIEKVLGFTPEERKQHSIEEVMTPESLQGLLMKFSEELQRDEGGVSDPGRSVSMDVEYYHKDGSTVWMENIANAIRDPDGAIIGVYGVSRDITDRKQAEKKLQQSEEKLRAIFNASPLAIVLIGEDGRVLDSNDTYAVRLKMSRDQLIGKYIWNLFPANVRGNRKMQTEGVFKTGKPFSGEDERDAVWNEYHIYPAISDESGNVTAVIVEVLDITWRKQAEKRLLEYRNNLEELVEQKTNELSLAIEELQIEVADRKNAESELEKRKNELEEMNSALEVLLRKRENDKSELEEKVMSNMKNLILPYMDKLKNITKGDHQLTYLRLIESNFQDILSPLPFRLSSKFHNLTPTEIKISSLIKNGETNKEIAKILNISIKTVEFHRDNIRKKLDLKNKKINLRSYLLSLP